MEKHGRAGQATVDNTIRCIRFACYITKARDTHSEYVTLTALPLQQRLQEGASALRLYVYYLSCFHIEQPLSPPYINRRLVFLMASKRALCEVRNAKQEGRLP